MSKPEQVDVAGDVEKASVQNFEDAATPEFIMKESSHALHGIDPKKEAALRRKIDLRIMPIISLIYLFCFIDRANIDILTRSKMFTGNARVAGLEADLGMSGLDYSVLLATFYAAYTFFEFPLQMVNKWIGPGKMIPILAFLFGIFSLCMTFVGSYGSAIALSRFYRKDELGFRLSCYIVCAPLAGAFGGLLASGLLSIDNIGAYSGWRNIFLVEGIITCGIAIISWFILPDRPETCKWLSPEERALAEARIKAENVGQSSAIDSMHWKTVKDGVWNPTTMVCALIFLFNNTTVQGVGFFLPTIIRTIYPGKTAIQVQLFSVPSYVVGAFTTLLTGYLSFKTKKRGLYMLLSAPFVCLTFHVIQVGYIMYLATMDAQVRFAASFMVAIGAFSFGALCNAWAAANVASDTARAAAIGTVVAFGNCAKDGPEYVPGNAFNLAGSTTMFILAGGLWWWQAKENRAKERGRDDHYLEGRTEEEIRMLGTRHPAWRYSY
ncbi:hypothetical protein Rhopal_004239-T1 [Rhodotorula paludigena]|uniref:MFS transporter n=1 Tax=Rhodotorula paludigena TaxID=86838 RepID=A0AAV5GFJ7_9BASI|nr:hypothetical protein Rhopal_004239-T1 [Rhodotorula paludigena]